MSELKPVEPSKEQQFPVHTEESFIQGVLQRNSDHKIPVVAEKEPETVQPSAKPTNVKEEVKPAESAPVVEQSKDQAPAETAQLVTEDDLVYLADKGLTDTDLDGKTIEEVAELVKSHKAQDNPTTEQPTGQAPVVTVSQEMADQIGGIAKSFVGKTAEDLLKAMQDQQAYIARLEAEKNKQPEPIKKEESTDIVDLDMFENDPEQQVKKITEIVAKVSGQKDQKELESLVQKVIKQVIPNIEDVQKVAVKQTTDAFLQEIKKGLPEGLDPEAEINTFKLDKQLTPGEIKFYMDYPNRLIKDVQDYAHSKDIQRKYAEITKSRDKEIKLQSFERFRKAMMSQKNTPVGASDVNLASRTVAKDNADWTVQKIRERHSAKGK